jgi:uncharacterized membrane protein YphA (DoxX/SURF4 family)
MTRGRRIRSIAGWALQALLAVAFVSIGLGKFGDPSWARSFVRWGYPEGFHLLVGGIEMTGGVLLLVPRLTTYAAASLMTVMLAAMLTHALAGQPPWRPLPHFVVLLTVFWLRWPWRWRRSTGAIAGAPRAV